MTDSRLDALLATLVPGDATWPSAGALGLGERVRWIAALVEGHTAALDAVLAALPDDFVTVDAEARTTAVRALEARDPDGVSVAVLLAYNAYYTDARVLEVVEAETGYAARPPQPLGYELEPFDESLLATVRKRAPFWRPV